MGKTEGRKKIRAILHRTAKKLKVFPRSSSRKINKNLLIQSYYSTAKNFRPDHTEKKGEFSKICILKIK